MGGLDGTVRTQLHGDLAEHILRRHLHVEPQRARIEAIRIRQDALKTGSKCVSAARGIRDERTWIWSHPVLQVDAQEVMGPVPRDRPADAAPVLRRGEVSDFFPRSVLTYQGAVRKIAEHGSPHGIGTRLGDGVDEAAGGGAVADIK